jgi:hypothetical protein
MSRSESVPTSRRLRLRGQQRSNSLDGEALDELNDCLAESDGNAPVDAVELAFDPERPEEVIDTLQQLTEADYELTVRELTVEIRR